MKCLIPGINVKILSRAIHALAKIGDDLYVESLPDELIIRTINSSDSAYCKMSFNKSFFTYYTHDYNKTNEPSVVCKISMKSALAVFKAPSHMDKQVETCEIKLDPDGTKLIFQIRCRHGITKTHFSSILESQKMDVTYDKEIIPNRILGSHKIFVDAVSNFQSSEDQLTFEVNSETFTVKNYMGNNADMSKITRTQVTLKPGEFETYTIETDSNVTFSMKEFKAMLVFAEAINLSILVYFETSGKPIIFEINNVTFETNFVIATERSDGVTQSTNTTVAKNYKSSCKRKMSSSVFDKASKKSSRENVFDIERCLDEDSDLFNFVNMPTNSRIRQVDSNKKANETGKDISMPDDFEVWDSDESPGSPILNTQTTLVRTVFKRCFETTFHPSNMKRVHAILADDSDCD